MNRQPTWDELLGWQAHDNICAWQEVIAEGESCHDDSAYRWLYGSTPTNPKYFDSFDDHPRVKFPLPDGHYTTAAGKFQGTETTWDDFCRIYGRKPFTPENQRLFAVWCTWRRGAIPAVLRGDVDEAIRLCPLEWTSLATDRIKKKAVGVFAAFGGRPQGAGPIPFAPDPPPTQEVRVTPHVTEVPMPAILAALLPTILQSIPQLVSVFSSPNDSEVAKRNQAAGVLVADTLVKATNAVNLQDAVQKIQDDPQALQAAHNAVNDLLPSLVDAGGGGIENARKASADPAQLPFWKQPALIFFFLAAPLVYMLAYSVFFKGAGVEWSDDARMMVATGVIALIGGGMAFFWNVVPKRAETK